MNIAYNDTKPSDGELEALAYWVERLRAVTVSLYRTSKGLHAFIVDRGGGEHNGIKIGSCPNALCDQYGVIQDGPDTDSMRPCPDCEKAGRHGYASTYEGLLR